MRLLDPAVTDTLVPLLADLTIKGTFILAGAGVVTTWGMRRASAATRHLVWSGAVAAVLLLPVVRAIAPRWTLSVVPVAVTAMFDRVWSADATDASTVRASEDDGAFAPLAPMASLSTASTEPLAPLRSTTAPAPPPNIAPVATSSTATMPAAHAWSFPSIRDTPRAISPVDWLAFVWATGALLVLARLAYGTVSLARLARRAQPAADPRWVTLLQSLARELGIRRPVTLLVGTQGDIPMTWGVVRPIVLLPPDAERWSDARRRAVLLHELAHVERFDTLTHIMSQLAVAALWFHPLALMASRRLRAERERACDDLVLAAGGVRPTAYADDLLELVQTLGAPRAMSAGLAMARPSEFEGRLLSILDPAAPRVRTDRRRAVGTMVIVAVAALPLAGLRNASAAERLPHNPLYLASDATPIDDRPYTGPRTTDLPHELQGPQRPNAAPRTSLRDDAGPGALSTPLAPIAPPPSPATDRVLTSPAAPLAPGATGIVLPPMGQPGALAGTTPGLGARAIELDAVHAGLAARASAAGGTVQESLAPDVVADLARAVQGMSSDTDRAAVMLKLVPHLRQSAEARGAFLEAVRTMSSDTQRRRVLVALVEQADDSTLAGALRVTREMSSDTERAAVLRSVVQRQRLASANVRARLFPALDAMSSESAREATLLAVIRAEPANDSLHLAVIASVARMSSEHAKANVLLALASGTSVLRNPATRTRFLDTLGKMSSSSEYRRVMDAVVR